MVAAKKACTCPTCAVVCKGRFGGCPEVWAAGLRPVAPPVVRVALAAPLAPTPAPASPAPLAPSVPAPVAAAVDPQSEPVTAALASIRDEVEVVHLDLGDILIGLKEVRATVDGLTRTTAANVDSLRQELAGVTQLLARQQAALDKLVEAQAAATGARSSYEQLVEERRLRMAAATTAEATVSPGLRGLLPRIQHVLHNGHTDAEHPIPAPDLPEADRQTS